MSDTSGQAPAHDTGKKSGGNFMTHKLGPLPMWSWIVIVVGVVIVYKIMKGKSAASTTASGTVTDGNNANSLFGSEGFSVNSAGQVVDNATGDILGGGTQGASGSSSSTTTNAGWFAAVQQALFNLGYDNSTVDSALQDYASGNKLSPTEYGIIEAGINLVGNPPSGLALPQLQPPAAPPAAAAPAAPAAPSVAAPLAEINASAWPTIIKYLQDANAATDFTQIGTVINGTYSGPQVTNGAPVYAGVLGGYAQDFNMATLPNGTAIYVPTTLYKQGYVQGVPAAA